MIVITGEHATADTIGAYLEKFALDHPPTITIENNGIGGYEFWGQKCFDRGTDYAVIEGESFTFGVVPDAGMNEDDLINIMSAVEGEHVAVLDNTIESKRGDEIEVRAVFVTENPRTEHGMVVFDGQWKDRD